MGADVVHHVLLTLATVIAAGYIAGRILRYFGQPPVIGEVVAGILLGPSCLGAISPEAMHTLIPSVDDDPHGRVSAALTAIAQLGVIFYMFLVGLELNAPDLRRQGRAAFLISSFSIAVPFAMGAALAWFINAEYSGERSTPTSFALYLGVAMAITAFPVLARILTDRKMNRTPLGGLALGCAAMGDVIAWILLSLVVGLSRPNSSPAWFVIDGTILFLVAMVLLVRPAAIRLVTSWDSEDRPLPAYALPAVFLGVLLSALTTEAIGIHAIFGAFIFGAIIPHESKIAHEFTAKVKDVVGILLLPAFFALTGLRLQIGLVNGWQDWCWCVAIILIATLGKFGGTYLAARLSGQPRRDSAALGALMNTRGLMELIVLNIGLELGVLGPKLYAMMVMMALATTMATAPMLHFIMKRPADADARQP